MFFVFGVSGFLQVTENPKDFKPAKSQKPPVPYPHTVLLVSVGLGDSGDGIRLLQFPLFDAISIFYCQILECVATCFLIGQSYFFSRNAIRMVSCVDKNSVSTVIGIYLYLLRSWGAFCIDFCSGIVEDALQKCSVPSASGQSSE